MGQNCELSVQIPARRFIVGSHVTEQILRRSGETMPDRTLDRESNVTDVDHLSLRLWVRLFTCHSMIERIIRARLRSEFNISLPRFDCLAQLARFPEGLMMNELSKRLMVTGGNVTGLTDQLAAEGLVKRTESPTDRRAIRVALTRVGKNSFARMARAHEAWVVELLGKFEAPDQQRLYVALGNLKHSIHAKSSPIVNGNSLSTSA